jgi:hypothetical protein
MTFHRASNSIVRGVKRRLETAKLPERLVEDSIKRFSLPGTHHQVTLFIAESADGKRVFVAELLEPDLPHIYQALPLPAPRKGVLGAAHAAKRDAADISKVMLTAILGIAKTVHSDPRFRRNVIVLNGP